MVKTGPNPLAQIAGRISESMQSNEKQQQNFRPVDGNRKRRFIDLKTTCEGKLVFSDFILSTNFKDKWILTNNQTIVAFCSVVVTKSKYFVRGEVVSAKSVYFEKPFKSSYLHIYIAEPVFSEETLVSVDSIFCKLVAIPRKEGVVFTPLMHTIQA